MQIGGHSPVLCDSPVFNLQSEIFNLKFAKESMSLRVEYSVTAACTPEQAWKAFDDLARWPSWNRSVSQARWLEGEPWQQGSRFYLEIVRPMELVLEPVITEAAPPNRIAWDGSGSLLSGENRFSFDSQPDGTTRLTLAGEFSGFGTLFWGDRLKSAVSGLFSEWLNALKAEAERISAGQAGSSRFAR